MKKLLLMIALASMAATTAFAAGGNGKDDKSKSKKTTEEVRKDKEAAHEAGSPASRASHEQALEAATTLTNQFRNVGNAEAEAARTAIAGYVTNGKISVETLNRLSKDSSDEAREAGTVLTKLAARGDGEGIAVFIEKQMYNKNAQWTPTGAEKRGKMWASALNAEENGSAKSAKDILTVGLEAAGFDKDTIREILKVCFGIA